MTRLFRCLLALIAVVLTTSAVGAQATGYITGSVSDAASGAPVVGAEIIVLGRGGAIVANARSGNGGQFRISNVPVGTYTVTARSITHRQAGQVGIAVVEGAPAIVSFELTASAAILGGIVVTGSREPEKAVESPASIHVRTEAEINTRPTTSVVDHIADVPGIDVSSGGLIQRNVVARGFNNIFSGSLLTLTDYRFAFVPSLRVNVPYLSTTSNEDIERVEVLLGPAAALYGPNSASGVLHVITRSPFSSAGTTVTVDAGNRSVLRGAIRHAAAPSQRFGYKASFEYFRGKDFTSVDSVELLEDPQVRRDFDIDKWSGEVRMDFRPREGAEIIATYGRAHAGQAIEPTGLGAAQIRDWNFDAYQLRGSVGRFFAQTFLNRSDAGETFLLRNRNDPDSGSIVDKSTQVVGQLQHGFGWGSAPGTIGSGAGETRSRFDLIYGLDYQLTNPKTGGTINGRNEDRDDITEIGGYLHATVPLTPQLELSGAIRADYHSRLEDHNDFGEPIFSPRAAIVFQPTANQAIRLTYNRAFSTPSTNNLSLDRKVGEIRIPPTQGFTVRALGTPQAGLNFQRTCTGGVGSGLCMRTPFSASPGTFIPANAAALYPAAVQVLVAQGLEARLAADPRLGAPGARAVVNRLQTSSPGLAEVGTQLRVLNPTTRQFTNVGPEYVRDIAAVEPTITNAFEIGYKGEIANRLALTVDLWSQRRDDFVGPLIVETPNVFLDRASLITYLTTNLTPVVGAAAAASLAPVIATGMAGIENAPSVATTGVPLGVINTNDPLNNATDIVLAYRNFGTVDLWGTDLGAEFFVTDRISLRGTYSYASKDFFPADAGGQDIALNAPTGKGSAGARYKNEQNGFSAELRNRWVKSFPIISGVYICNGVTPACPEGKLPSYSLLDAQLSLRPTVFPSVMLSLSVTNALDKEHQQFIGGGVIGRLIMTRVQYTF